MTMGQPREVDIDILNCPHELLESIEDLQYTVEELQDCCGEQEKQNQELQQQLIKKEKEYNRKTLLLNDELSALRHTKVRIAKENIMKECPVTPRWFTALTKSVEQEKKIADLISKVDELKLVIMERDKAISSLKHQLKDSQATVVVLTSERNRMAVEVDELALRLEEMEYSNDFRKTDAAKRHGSKDEAVNSSTKNRTLPRSTSLVTEEEATDFTSLKRAANFSNINSLDESTDFKQERQQSTPLKKLVENGRDEGDSALICEENQLPLAALENTVSYGDSCDRTIKETRAVKMHKDTSWEKFDRSDSSAALCSLSKSVKETVTPISLDDSTKLDAFKEPDKCSPFTKLVESTPVAKYDRNIDSAESLQSDLESNGIKNPWMSPGQSPVAERKSETLPRNLFWERNEIRSTCPFYIPDTTDEGDAMGNGLAGSSGLNDKLPLRTDCDLDEALNDNFDAISPPSVPSNFSFDEKMTSFDEDSKKPSHVVLRKSFKENLWDFEPDSIVDVSTGQTIYESMKKDGDSQISENGACVENEVCETKQSGNDLSCLEKYLLVDSHARSVSDITNDVSEEKARSLPMVLDRRSNSRVDGNSHQKEREFVRKGKRKEREALKTYMQWKTEGKHGTPPANFKISMC